MIRATLAGDAGTPTRSPTPAVYLASDESAFVHGTVIDVDDGRANIAAMATYRRSVKNPSQGRCQNWRYCAAFARGKSPSTGSA